MQFKITIGCNKENHAVVWTNNTKWTDYTFFKYVFHTVMFDDREKFAKNPMNFKLTYLRKLWFCFILKILLKQDWMAKTDKIWVPCF